MAGIAAGARRDLCRVRGLGALVSPRRRDRLAFILVFAGVVAWWIAIPPSHDRNWRPEVAVMPRAFIDGDRVRITGVRNFEYRSRNDFTVSYEEREVSLSHLTGSISMCPIGPRGWWGTPSLASSSTTHRR